MEKSSHHTLEGVVSRLGWWAVRQYAQRRWVTKLNPEGQAGGGCVHRTRPGKPVMTVTETKIITHHRLLSTVLFCGRSCTWSFSLIHTHTCTCTHTHTLTQIIFQNVCLGYLVSSPLCNKQVD